MSSIYLFDMELGSRISRVVRKFPESFGHIAPEDILPIHVEIDGKPPDKIAEVSLVPKDIQVVTPYKVRMLVYGSNYDELLSNVKNLVVVHELEHIELDPKDPDQYKLKKHTVQDWSVMVRLMGPHWFSRAGRIPALDIMGADTLSWQDGLAQILSEIDLEVNRGNPNARSRKRRKVRSEGNSDSTGRNHRSSSR